MFRGFPNLADGQGTWLDIKAADTIFQGIDDRDLAAMAARFAAKRLPGVVSAKAGRSDQKCLYRVRAPYRQSCIGVAQRHLKEA